MATNTAPLAPPARHFASPVVQYLRRDFTFSTADATTLDIGTIPAGSVILRHACGINISTVFNAGTNNFVDIGASTDSGTNNFGTQISLLTADFLELDVTGSYYVADETRVQALITLSGTAATTGAAQIIIAFVEDNDL